MIPLYDTVPSRHPPVMTGVLIAVNAVVFLYQLTLAPEVIEPFFQRFGLVPARVTGLAETAPFGVQLTFITSMFLHGGWFHILVNMWMLWLFGDNVEDRMGPVRFLLFYLLCGFAAGAMHVAAHPESTVPTIGASGAVSAVLGAYALLYPTARLIIFVPVLFLPLFFQLPALLFVVLWFFFQFLSGLIALVGPEAAAGVAWWAHIGGFVAGLLLYRLFLLPRRR